jgi:hypothetical protein
MKAQKVDVIVDSQITGIAWGQFLDADNHSGTHWGRFGTSAAVQVLAMDLHWSPEDGAQRKIADVHPVSSLAEHVLPSERLPPGLPEDLKPQDMSDPMKVAFLVDAVQPDACEDRVQDLPDIVDLLLELAVDTDGWSTRPTDDKERREKDRLLITAYALYALRRFPAAQISPKISGAWTWLAQEVLDGAKTMGQDLLALSCLALGKATRQVRNETVDEAQLKGLAELYEWARNYREPLVTRYYFNTYSRGKEKSYLFLSPELLCALLFLNATNPPRKARVFALDVVRAVADNIVPPDLPAELQGLARGFTIQRGMEGTVDQMWALRLLRTFHLRNTTDPRAIRPSRLPWPTVGLGAFVLSTIALFFAAKGGFGTGSGASIGIGLAGGLCSASLSMFLFDVRERRRYDRW